MTWPRRIAVAALVGGLALSLLGFATSARMRARERAARDMVAGLHLGDSASEVRAALRLAGVPFEETRLEGATGFDVSSISWLDLFVEERVLGIRVEDRTGLAYAIEDRIVLFDEVGAVSVPIPPPRLPVFGEEPRP